MAQVEPVLDVDVEDRLAVWWHVLFAVTLALPTAITLFFADLSAQDRMLVMGGAVAFGGLHWLVIVRHPQWWERRHFVLAGYWLIACGLTAVLANLHNSYLILLYGLYPLMFITLGWWGVVPIVGFTAVFGWAAGGWASGEEMITSLLASAGLATLVGAFVTAIARQNEQRRDALKALAETRAELAETARHAGVLAERERLARELHDTIAQGFTSVVMQLESAEQALTERPDDAREHLEKARRTARENLGEVRRTVSALRPELLEGSSLSQAVARAVEAWSEAAGIAAETRITGDAMTLTGETEVNLLRVTQEALNNIAKHARASQVVVSLSYLGDTVTLDIDDDGVGFAGRAGPWADGGFGLIGMRERIASVGGELSVESAPGEGTTIAVSVPA
jgi:signal transduction histidine kinase